MHVIDADKAWVSHVESLRLAEASVAHVDECMAKTIEAVRCYLEWKKSFQGVSELDYGVLTELLLALGPVMDE